MEGNSLMMNKLETDDHQRHLLSMLAIGFTSPLSRARAIFRYRFHWRALFDTRSTGMASLIKNEIIKRLSKFVKNLSANQIHLSTLKGEGELTAIDLDEHALEEVTELPTWLKIHKATCGRVFIKIPWTSLKTLPIHLQLDDVNVEIETTEELRELHQSKGSATNSDSLLGKYGFTQRVIDGISLTVNNVTFTIKAKQFQISIFLPSLDMYSISPRGERVETLKSTRLRNAAKDHILLFKEISWANARIEASTNESNEVAAAIRFIANACRIRIAMKKRCLDSTMITSRVMLHFDDLLSVVNDAQLKSVLKTYKEIHQLIKRASEQRKRKVGDRLTKADEQGSAFQPRTPTTGTNDPLNVTESMTNPTKSSDPFERYDVLETSLHFNIKRLDFHLIAESETLKSRFADSGSLQMTMANISVDHYPYHQHGSPKQHWIKYSDLQSSSRNEWAQLLKEQWNDELKTAKGQVSEDEMSVKLEKALESNRICLFESCTVLNVDDLVFYPVSSAGQKRRRPLLKSDLTQYQLPEHLGVINVQFTEYYYPLPYAFPVPSSDVHIQLMPIVIRVDFATFSWLNAFASAVSLTIDKSGVLTMDGPVIAPEHLSIHFEAMLPRIVVSSDLFAGAYQLEETKKDEQPLPDQLERPEGKRQEDLELLELNISKLIVSNVRTNRTKLQQHLNFFQESDFFHSNQFPFSNAPRVAGRISSLFKKTARETFLYKNPLNSELPEPQSTSTAMHSYYTMTTDSLKKSGKFDLWSINAENIYLDFTPSSSPSVPCVKQNMTDTFSLQGWVVLDETLNGDSPWLNILGVLETPSMVKISQKQYTFLMHLVDEFGLFLDVLDHTDSVKPPSKKTKMTVCVTCPSEFTLAVLDGLIEVKVDPATALPRASLPEPELRDTSDGNIVVDLVAASVPIVAGTTKLEETKAVQLSGEKIEEQIPRGLEIASPINANNVSDESSEWDELSDLDAESDAASFTNELGPSKAARIDLGDDDSLKFPTEKNSSSVEPVNGVLVKLNRIHVCLTNEEKENTYLAASVKYLRVDEFRSLKFETLKPKLFEDQLANEHNEPSVPPALVRIDFPKGQHSPPPSVTVKLQDRTVAIATHAIDVFLQTLEEIHTDEEKRFRRSRPTIFVPIDVDLHNIQLNLEMLHEVPTTEAVTEVKPPMKVHLDQLHVLRQIDGAVLIQSPDPSDELRRENERLREELKALKNENPK